MTKHAERARCVSYLRVSTVEQAEKELSLIAQRHAATDFAGRHGAVIDCEYVEAGASGTDSHRPVLNQLLGDALQPGSTISTIVVPTGQGGCAHAQSARWPHALGRALGQGQGDTAARPDRRERQRALGTTSIRRERRSRRMAHAGRRADCRRQDLRARATASRASRAASQSGARCGQAAKPHVLSGLVWCGKCGASYQLETSGKRVDGTVYRYCYYNCRSACRAGVEACAGFRIPTGVLDTAVLAALARVACTSERARGLVEGFGWPVERMLEAWRALLTCDPEVSRAYALHLIDRVEVNGERVLATPKACGRNGEPSLLDIASE